jgi:hypothetical protein
MQRFLWIAAFFMVNAAVPVLAGHPDSAAESRDPTKPRPLKATLAIGAGLDKSGGLWLARIENQQLMVSRSDDNGVTFSTPIVVTPEPENIVADGENRPKIAIAEDGTVLVTWTQSLPQKLYAANVRFSRSTDRGNTFSKPVTLNDDERITSHSFDALAIDGAGRVAVAWLDGRDKEAAKEKSEDFSGVSIYAVQSEDNGASFAANRRAYQHICECCRVGLSWTKEGPVALWRNIFGTNTRDFAIANLDQANIRRVTDDEWKVDACPHNGGAIAEDGRSQLHLVWFTNGQARQGLFYKRIDGDWESQPVPIGDPSAQPNHVSVAAEGKTIIITWREFDGRFYSAQLKYSNDGGASWSASQRLMESSGATDYPLPLIDKRKAVIVWNTATEGLRVLHFERRIAVSAR